MTIDEDYELVQSSRRGQVDQFEILVEKYQQRIYLLVYGVVLNRELAEDLTQEVFIKAWRALSRFRGKSKFYTWIYKIALNLALDAKKKRRHIHISFDESQDGYKLESRKSSRPDREVLSKELHLTILRGMEELNHDQRTTLVLREWDQLSYEEIARVMKCSVGTVMSRLYYARDRLGKYLKDYLRA